MVTRFAESSLKTVAAHVDSHGMEQPTIPPQRCLVCDHPFTFADRRWWNPITRSATCLDCGPATAKRWSDARFVHRRATA
ncbi:MAG: hypothetical protein AAGD33_06555 [Actinomycetota bacterium]